MEAFLYSTPRLLIHLILLFNACTRQCYLLSNFMDFKSIHLETKMATYMMSTITKP